MWWLYRDNLLPSETKFIGYARSKLTVDELKEKCRPYMKVSERISLHYWLPLFATLYVIVYVQVKDDQMEKFEQFWAINYYVAGSYDGRRDFEMLNQEISRFDNVNGANRLFYLALPPSVFESVTVHIKSTCMGSK